jgi:hypothetical protein
MKSEESKTGEPARKSPALEQLIARCEAANLTVSEEDDYFDEGGKNYILELPAGREKHRLYLSSEKQIERLLSIRFERYVSLWPYEAICSYADGTIESSLRILERTPSRHLIKRIFGTRSEDDDDDPIELTLKDESRSIELSLGPPSEALKELLPRAARAHLSLKLKGLSVSRHEDAVKLLQRVSDSLFFQIDTSIGVGFNLARDPSDSYRLNRQNRPGTLDDLQFPTQEYDEAPMSLYWYARGAHGMPLLQYLAYYQVIEFYYPTYFQAEARRKIRRILKDPSFRAERDADLGRVLSSLTGGRGGIGDERSMLKATVQECLDPTELRDFICAVEERAKFLSSKAKGLSSIKIPIANESADLRNDVADRLYEIRCKIVHTKGDSREGEVELLLPFSAEANQLNFDIELVQYVAQQVLITASANLRLT